MNTQKTLLATLALSSALFGAALSPAYAVEELNTAPGLSAAGAPVGLHGTDPVALVTTGKNVTGTATFTGVDQGVAYYFASQENLNAFKAAPAKYTPENGGFCTFGVSVAKKFDGDPRYAAVVEGKLYVFLNEAIYQMFLKDKAGTIAKASGNWPKIQHTAAAAL
jgi:YHS domain-containing protein